MSAKAEQLTKDQLLDAEYATIVFYVVGADGSVENEKGFDCRFWHPAEKMLNEGAIEEVQKLIKSGVKKAVKEDWSTEYLDLILSVRVVGSTTQAMEHINQFGSHHSDAIISNDKREAEEFLKAVDSATVYGSLQQAIDLANEGDTVYVKGTCYGVNSRQNFGATDVTQNTFISKNLTINGNWASPYATLDAMGNGRVASELQLRSEYV